MNKQLEGKVAALTGGNSGIGLATVKEFAAQGAQVAILARSQDKLDAALAEIGRGAEGFVGDVTDLSSLEAFCNGVGQRFGGIDILFANAGIGEPTPLSQTDEAAFDRTVGINFKGIFFTVKYALPHLREGASLILVSSCLDEMGVEGYSVYGATKAAVRSLARSFTPELRPIRARINVLSPGPVKTPIEAKAGFSAADVDAHRELFAKALSAGRMGEPEEMAKVALFLASDDSSFLYGSEIQADGGMNQTRWQL